MSQSGFRITVSTSELCIFIAMNIVTGQDSHRPCSGLIRFITALIQLLIGVKL